MSTPLRVNEEEFDEPGEREYRESDERVYYHGALFTGVGILEHGKGRLSSEYNYKDGFPDGLCREWHPNGQLKLEYFAVRGRAEGRRTSWHENGKVAETVDSESGIVLHRQTWDAQGKLLEEYKIDEASSQYQRLQKMRLQAASAEGQKAS